jgi:hypothetical protein
LKYLPEFFAIAGEMNPAGPSAEEQALFRLPAGGVQQHAVL